MALLSLVSILTSLVPICFSANFLISCEVVACQYHARQSSQVSTLTALGALYLKPMPCSLLCMLMVYSLVTTWIACHRKIKTVFLRNHLYSWSGQSTYLSHGGSLLLLSRHFASATTRVKAPADILNATWALSTNQFDFFNIILIIFRLCMIASNEPKPRHKSY